MEVQVQLPSPINFDYNHGQASPNAKGFGEFYFSAPTSPARASEIYGEFEDFTFATTKEFTSHQLAERLLKGGKIQALKPPPNRVVVDDDQPETVKSPLLYPQSLRTPKSQQKKSLWSTLSPKRRKEGTVAEAAMNKTDTRTGQGRGRDRSSAVSTSRSRRRGARSLSPSRLSKYSWEEEQKPPQNTTGQSASPSSLSPSSPVKGGRKWRLKDFLLFRSASEGRASDKDPFKKYAQLHRRHEVAKSSGSPPTEGSSVVPASRRRPISAHELHYTINKAMSQDMKMKSFLPYKQGILGRLSFHPTVHSLGHGFGSLPHYYG